MRKDRIIVIAGPTAVGKTEFAIRAAQDFNGEIVSADSMQLYKFMDIGSAKPTREERAAAVHYLVDEIDPRQPFSVAEYRTLAMGYIEKILGEGKVPVISGGTGLYVNALLYDMDFSGSASDPKVRRQLQEHLKAYGPESLHELLQKEDPKAAGRIHPNNTRKVIRAIEAARAGRPIPEFEEASRKEGPYDYLLIGLDRQRAQLYDRINRRVDLMMEAGLQQEIQRLMEMGLDSAHISMKGIGYKEMIDCMKGEYSMEEAVELIKRNSRRYAKRQLTWFRRYPDIHWFDLSADADAAYGRMKELISEFLKEPEEAG